MSSVAVTQNKTQNIVQNPHYEIFSSKKLTILASSLLAASATLSCIALKWSFTLYIGGGIVLPLLAAGCIFLYNECFKSKSTASQVLNKEDNLHAYNDYLLENKIVPNLKVDQRHEVTENSSIDQKENLKFLSQIVRVPEILKRDNEFTEWSDKLVKILKSNNIKDILDSDDLENLDIQVQEKLMKKECFINFLFNLSSNLILYPKNDSSFSPVLNKYNFDQVVEYIETFKEKNSEIIDEFIKKEMNIRKNFFKAREKELNSRFFPVILEYLFNSRFVNKKSSVKILKLMYPSSSISKIENLLNKNGISYAKKKIKEKAQKYGNEYLFETLNKLLEFDENLREVKDLCNKLKESIGKEDLSDENAEIFFKSIISKIKFSKRKNSSKKQKISFFINILNDIFYYKKIKEVDSSISDFIEENSNKKEYKNICEHINKYIEDGNINLFILNLQKEENVNEFLKDLQCHDVYRIVQKQKKKEREAARPYSTGLLTNFEKHLQEKL